MKKLIKSLFIFAVLSTVHSSQSTVSFAQCNITVTVMNPQNNSAMKDVNVGLIAFTATGEPDGSATQLLATDVTGSTCTTIGNGVDFQIALSTPGYFPSLRDQIQDPNANFRVKGSATPQTKVFYLYPAPPGFLGGTLGVSVSSISAPANGKNQLVLAEVFFNSASREPAGYGIIRATATNTSVVPVFNLGQNQAGGYGLRISEPGRGRSAETIIGSPFPQVGKVDVDLTNALPPNQFENTSSTLAASVEGVIQVFGSNAAVPGFRLTLSQFLDGTPNANCNCIMPTFLADTFTDGNGRFQFFGVPGSTTTYNLFGSKLGYYGVGLSVARSTFATTTTKLSAIPVVPATYTLTGVVRYNGIPMPVGDVSTNGDFENWTAIGNDTYGGGGNHGAAHDGRVKVSGTGAFTVAGIPDGNLWVNVNFHGGNYNFNYGPNGQRDFSGNVRGGDDRRVLITSHTIIIAGGLCASPGCPAGSVLTLNASGVVLSSGTQLVFDVSPPAGTNSGSISGTVSFITTFTVSGTSPLVIPASTPIAIVATQDYQGGSNVQRIGVAAIAGTFTSNTTTYSIALATGSQYHLDIFSSQWGKAQDLDDRADLSSSTSAVRNFLLTRSGRLIGQVRFPDGSNYRPVFGPENSPVVHFINIEATGVTSDGRCNAQVDDFGAFECPNVAPGIYKVRVEPRGNAADWPVQTITDVVVFEGKTTTLAVKLKNSLYVQPQIFGLPTLSTDSWHFKVVAFAAGYKLNQSGLASAFISDKGGASFFSVSYDTTTATWATMKMEAGSYDFYLLLEQQYAPDKPPYSYYNFQNFIGQSKAVAVQKSDTQPNLGTKLQPITVSMLGSIGQAMVTGTVKGSKLFTVTDLARIYQNFNEIFSQLPALVLYDAAGDLKGYSAGLPSQTGYPAIVPALEGQNTQGFLDALAANPLAYRVAALPPGKYTAVFMNPNYPPVVKDLELASGDTTEDFDFDANKVLAGTIKGVVKSTVTGQGIPDATISIKHRSLERIRRTDATGKFQVDNMPAGVYRIEATKGGFTTAGNKAALSANGTLNLTFVLHPTTSSITGLVFLKKFPTPSFKDGVEVIAYDETANVLDSEAYLPRTSVLTSDDGSYFIPGVLPGHKYKISAITPGKLLETILVDALPGVTVAPDILLKDSPPEITLKIRKSADNIGKIDLVVKSPKELRAAPAGTFNPGKSYDSTSASNFTFIPGPENTYLGRFTPSPTNRFYTIRVTAGESNNQLTKTIVYDQFSDSRAEQFVHEAAIAGGDVSLDEEKEDFSGLELDAGSLTISTGSVADFSNLIGGFFSSLPSVKMVKTARGTSDSVASLIESLLASDVYDIDLSSAQQNKSVTLTLKYDKQKVTDTGALRIRQYNSATGEWDEVPGNYTVDPLTGVVSVNVDSIQNASAGSDVNSPLKTRKYARSKVSAQGTFVPDATSSSNQSGQFAVFSAAPPTNVAYAGEGFSIYNLPNPFNLKTKTVTISTDGQGIYGTTHDVRGTLIKYHLPGPKSGHVKLLIYNVAGELVRELDEGTRAGGFVYYSEWDGKNSRGSDCASGVYFLLTQVGNDTIGGKAHKMALVK